MEEAPPEVYMPERALFRALEAWLPEFRFCVDADGKRQTSDNDDEIKSEWQIIGNAQTCCLASVVALVAQVLPLRRFSWQTTMKS